ncbi:hypothetical protein L0664_12345 [Octadecabacter sp. G9-8]|uniref:Uncharacterized protein n=1 Tax=Octadecabacter dasysiphoniae TaxID=2909341 RepID=A0ABS9D0C7_9RHOB|nr:hypothetical protein [Octadecabacter dasysiphoniae]MCF2871861.1 hypothetical protein [Octadecabacter dasysiphoniae]
MVLDGGSPTSTGGLMTQWAGDLSARNADYRKDFALLLARLDHQPCDIWRKTGCKTKPSLVEPAIRCNGEIIAVVNSHIAGKAWVIGLIMMMGQVLDRVAEVIAI